MAQEAVNVSGTSENKSGWGDPTWEVAHLFPSQGAWSVADYLALDTNHLVEKRKEYAQAGIAEYWIIDPRDTSITILTMEANAQEYSNDAIYRPGDRASSRRLAGFSIPVADVFLQS